MLLSALHSPHCHACSNVVYCSRWLTSMERRGDQTWEKERDWSAIRGKPTLCFPLLYFNARSHFKLFAFVSPSVINVCVKCILTLNVSEISSSWFCLQTGGAREMSGSTTGPTGKGRLTNLDVNPPVKHLQLWTALKGKKSKWIKWE